VRLLLILLLIGGLAPALGEVAEAVVHYAVEGHLAHSAADQGDLGELGDEHGCGTTQHRCGCCTSQTVLSADGVWLTVSQVVAAGPAVAPAALASLHEPTPPFRPPIRS
jgi:hypothetical protein